MFKFLLRKRFVCGQGINHYCKSVYSYSDTDWITSFKTKEEALQWCLYSRYFQVVYDRKSKITASGNKAKDYLNNLNENND